MSYVSPVPKLDKVKAGVHVPPDMLATIDQACHVLGLSRNSWLFGLVVLHLPELTGQADARMALVRRGQNGPVPHDRRAVKVAESCPTLFPLPPKPSR